MSRPKEAGENRQPKDRFVDAEVGGPFIGVAAYTLRKWGWQGRIPRYKIGRRVLFKVSDLMDLMECCRQEADPELKLGK